MPKVQLLGGPWDGAEKEWPSEERVQRVVTIGVKGAELHEYIQKPDNPLIYVYTGRIDNRKRKSSERISGADKDKLEYYKRIWKYQEL